MSNFNIGANNFGFVGNALVGGKLTKKYTKFVKDNPKAPLPIDKIFNQNTRRIVKKSLYYTKKGFLRKKYLDAGYAPSKQTIKVLPQLNKTTTIGFTYYIGDLGGGAINDRVEFKDLLLNNLNQLNNKLIRVVFTINPNETREVSFTINDGHITPAIKEYAIDGDTSDGEGFFNAVNIRGGGIRIYIYKPIKATQKAQKFLDGLDYNCVLHPIFNYYQTKIDNAETTGTKKKYQTEINKINGKKGKEGLFEKYKDGFTIDGLKELVKHLRINVEVFSPFLLYDISLKGIKQKSTLHLDAFIEAKHPNITKNTHTFKYINSRLDHLSEIVCDGNPLEMLDNLDSIKQKYINENEYYQYQVNRNKTIVALQTAFQNYKLIDNSVEIIEDFEKINNLQNCFIYTNDKYNDFILDGVHYNSCIDFKDKKGFCNHIDMEKAYYNFKKNPLYDGFLYLPTNYSNKITKEFALNNVGYYKINNLTFTNVSKEDIQILTFVKYNDNCVYPHADLKLLYEMKVGFNVVEGFFGDKLDLDFGEDMKTKFKDGQENEEGIGLYSSWTGLQNSTSLKSSHYIKKDLEFLQTLKFEAEQIGKKC